MKIVRTMGLLAVLLVILPIAARADFMVSVGGANCGSCYGGTYTLNFVGANTGSTFTVTLTITTPSDPNSVVAGQYISGVNWGDGKNITSVKLLSTTAGGSWSDTQGAINSNGSACDGTPDKKVCSQQNKNVAPFNFALANGSTYSWTWTVTFATAGLNTNLADVHIGAQYQDQTGSTGHIVSETGLAMPEAPAAATLAIGLLLLAFKLRRND